jgi:phosphatidylserine/phosphatidylglycerophosphate/cardiolipin synthase-like enzyme
MTEILTDLINKLASELPIDVIEKMARILIESENKDCGFLQLKLKTVMAPVFRPHVDQLIEICQKYSPELNPESIGFGLLASAKMIAKARKDLQIELVWTGPESLAIPLRRTDQALLQLVESANKKIWIVSFAVYKAKHIIDALVKAANRKVAVNILVELENESHGRLSHDAFQALGDEIKKCACIYYWPFDKRPCSPNGSPGVVHAKCAVADGKSLFISSANLTDYALNLNMEMGLLIQGGDTPGNVERHFDGLVSNKVIQLYSLMDA